MQDRMDAGHVRCKTGWMLLRSDAGGQVICITGLMQDRKEAVQDRYRIGRMQYSSDAGHYRCRVGQMQERSHAGQVRCFTIRVQYRSDTVQDGCRTGLLQV